MPRSERNGQNRVARVFTAPLADGGLLLRYGVQVQIAADAA